MMKALRGMLPREGSLDAAVGQIASLTALSRVLGFIRDILIAVFIGAGPVADAFFVAFKLPNLFRRMTAEGALTNAFMPVYTEARKKGVHGEFANEIQTVLIWGLVAVVILMEIAMPVIIGLIAPGFGADDPRAAMAVDFARITMPYLPMISLVALWAAVANAHDRFFGGAVMPVVLNLGLITGAVAAGFGAAVGAWSLVIAVPVAGVLQVLLMARLLGGDKRPGFLRWPRFSKRGKRMWRIFFPAALGAGGGQLNLLVDMILASLLPVGAISALYFGDRIAQLPLGVIGIALGTALLPRLARFEIENDGDAVMQAIGRALALGMFFAIPAMSGAIILREEIIGGLFAYGAFDAARIEPVAWVLAAYALGIPAFILAKILQPVFFAAEDARTPMLVSFAMIAVNIVFSIILMRVLGAAGIALATAIASWFSVMVMVTVLWQRERMGFAVLGGFIAPMVLSAVMAAMLLGGQWVLAATDIPRLGSLMVLMALGLGSYLGLAWGFGLMPKGNSGLDDAAQPSHKARASKTKGKQS